MAITSDQVASLRHDVKVVREWVRKVEVQMAHAREYMDTMVEALDYYMEEREGDDGER